jgi:predicted PurR-regulated permease PerM
LSDSNAFWSQPGRASLFVLAAFAVVCAGVKLAAPVLVPVVLGVFIATVNVPLVSWLSQRRVPMAVALGLALVVDALALTAFSSLLLVSAGRLSIRLPEYRASLQAAESQFSESLRAHGFDAGWKEVVDPVSVVSVIASLASDVAFVLIDLGLALVIAAFLLFRFVRLGADRSNGLGLGAERVRRAVREMYRYITVKTLTSIATGALIGVWLWTIGAELPTLFGLLAFLLNFIPALGSILAVVLALVVALLEHGLQHGMLVVLGYVVVNVVVGSVVEPKLMGRALGLWPLVILLSVVFWGWMLGLVGAVLSALLTQVVKVVLLSTPDLRWVGLAMGPRPKATTGLVDVDLLEEAMPPSVR